MCYHLSATERRELYLNNKYHIITNRDGSLKSYWHVSGFDHPIFNILTQQNPTELQDFEWGLIPYWVKDAVTAEQLRKQTINAKSETIFEKPSFRDSILRRRCLIPVDGFFEWFHRDAKNKIPFYIYLKDQEPFFIGGIYDSWTDRNSGISKKTFSIVTTDANPLMAAIHNSKKRMPLILPRGTEMNWLKDASSDDITLMMQPLSEDLMTAHTISRRITDRKLSSNVPEVIEKYPYPELMEREQGLFSAN